MKATNNPRGLGVEMSDFVWYYSVIIFQFWKICFTKRLQKALARSTLK